MKTVYDVAKMKLYWNASKEYKILEITVGPLPKK